MASMLFASAQNHEQRMDNVICFGQTSLRQGLMGLHGAEVLNSVVRCSLLSTEASVLWVIGVSAPR